jgi:hypothetical protein
MTGFLLGNDGGLYRYDLAGLSFTPLNSTISAAQFQAIGPHPSSASIALGGFQDNGTALFTNDPGWESVDTDDGGFTLFDPNDPAYAYHTYASPGGAPAIAASTDGGNTWNFAGPSNALGIIFGSDFANFYPSLAADPAVAHRVLFGAALSTYVSRDGMFTGDCRATSTPKIPRKTSNSRPPTIHGPGRCRSRKSASAFSSSIRRMPIVQTDPDVREAR